MSELTIPLPDGGALAATSWEPEAPARAALVVHPAVATPARFYRAFATTFADAGFAVLTYDYRGTGGSGSAREHAAVGMREWMSVDAPAATAWLRAHHPALPAFAVGHSVGGHALALDYAADGLTAFATVASHAGVTAAIPDRVERARVGAFFALGPPASRLLGYAPSKLAGFGVDIPDRVLQDWAPWTRLPGYFFDDPSMRAAERAARVSLPVLAVGARDDPWATPQQIEAITDRMVSTAVERRTYAPADLGVERIGHHGLMRRGIGERFWADLAEWFLARVP